MRAIAAAADRELASGRGRLCAPMRPQCQGRPIVQGASQGRARGERPALQQFQTLEPIQPSSPTIIPRMRWIIGFAGVRTAIFGLGGLLAGCVTETVVMGCRLAAVTRMAEGLPVSRVPEQIWIAAVRADVVNMVCRLPALQTTRIPLQKSLARVTPARSCVKGSSGCITQSFSV